MLRIMLVRDTGLQEKAGVICSTATVPNGATTDEDFVGRPRNSSSVVYFDAGSTRTHCPIEIINDRKWESRERFIVALSSAGGPTLIASKASTLCVYVTSEDGMLTLSYPYSNQLVLLTSSLAMVSKHSKNDASGILIRLTEFLNFVT